MSGGCAVVGGMSVTGLDFVEADVEKEGEAEVLMVGEAGAVALSESGRRKTQNRSLHRS